MCSDCGCNRADLSAHDKNRRKIVEEIKFRIRLWTSIQNGNDFKCEDATVPRHLFSASSTRRDIVRSLNESARFILLVKVFQPFAVSAADHLHPFSNNYLPGQQFTSKQLFWTCAKRVPTILLYSHSLLHLKIKFWSQYLKPQCWVTEKLLPAYSTGAKKTAMLKH